MKKILLVVSLLACLFVSSSVFAGFPGKVVEIMERPDGTVIVFVERSDVVSTASAALPSDVEQKKRMLAMCLTALSANADVIMHADAGIWIAMSLK